MPTTVLVIREPGAARPADVAAVTRRLRTVDGVAAVQAGGRSKDGRIARLLKAKGVG